MRRVNELSEKEREQFVASMISWFDPIGKMLAELTDVWLEYLHQNVREVAT